MASAALPLLRQQLAVELAEPSDAYIHANRIEPTTRTLWKTTYHSCGTYMARSCSVPASRYWASVHDPHDADLWPLEALQLDEGRYIHVDRLQEDTHCARARKHQQHGNASPITTWYQSRPGHHPSLASSTGGGRRSAGAYAKLARKPVSSPLR